WAAPADDLTTIDAGPAAPGRARGALVDPDLGAQPQLAVVPATDPVLTVRRGSTTADVLVLGSLLGAAPAEASTPAAITVDSPAPGALDLGDQLTFTFEGAVLPGAASPLRIEVRR